MPFRHTLEVIHKQDVEEALLRSPDDQNGLSGIFCPKPNTKAANMPGFNPNIHMTTASPILKSHNGCTSTIGSPYSGKPSLKDSKANSNDFFGDVSGPCFCSFSPPKNKEEP